MSRYYIGMKVRTSYGTGPYKIVSVSEECTCPSFVNMLNLRENAPKSAPHFHLVCKSISENGDRGNFYLNGYDNNLHSVWSNDYLIDLDEVTPTILALLL